LLRYLLAAGVGIAMIAVITCSIAGSYYLIRASLNRAPDAPYRWLVKANGFNAVLFPDQLSDLGKRYRARYLTFLIATICAVTAMVTFAAALAVSQ
jgi:hypothetical protein